MSLKKRVRKSIALALVGVSMINPMLNMVSAMENNMSYRNKDISITQIGENSFLLKDNKDNSVSLCELDYLNMNGIITDKDGNKSYLTTEIQSYDDNGNPDKIISKINEEVVLEVNSSMDSLTQEEIKEIEVDQNSLVRSNYNYKLINRYEFKVNATSSKTNIAMAILGVVTIPYSTMGACLAVAGLVMTLYNELVVPKMTALSVNVLYGNKAPTNLQIKSVFRIYGKTGNMVKMYTSFKAVSV